MRTSNSTSGIGAGCLFQETFREEGSGRRGSVYPAWIIVTAAMKISAMFSFVEALVQRILSR
jgi:hypothetical protein